MQAKRTTPVEVRNLKQLRDELRVQAHLFKGDAKKRWQDAEKGMEKFLKSYSTPVQYAAKRTAPEIKRASNRLLKSLKQGYSQLKRSLPS